MRCCAHLKNIYEDFYEHHTSIILIVATQENADVDGEEQKRKSFDDKYYFVEATFYDMFTPVGLNTTPSTSTNSQGADSVKLPKLNILIFTGDLLPWPTFHGLH